MIIRNPKVITLNDKFPAVNTPFALTSLTQYLLEIRNMDLKRVFVVDENCRDKYFNCNVVVQARLCVYDYYKTTCCASCSRVTHRQTIHRGRS